jgi:mycothiol synthase
MTEFPPGYVLREATEADAEAAAEVLNAAGFADGAPREITADDIRQGLPLYEVRVLEGPGGELVGYFDLWVDRERAFVDAAVHPDARNRGLGRPLIEAVEAVAREKVDSRPDSLVRTAIAGGNEPARELHGRCGYAYIRSFFRMEIALDVRPANPDWPDGIDARPFRPGDERRLYETLNDAFRDHWEGERREPYEQFARLAFFEETFRPSATFLAFERDEPVAAVLSAHRFGMGWIPSLGVRPQARRRGLGEALLRRAFGALYDEGERRVGLGVDAENTTGATRLYERAGMHVAARFDSYEKKLNAA